MFVPSWLSRLGLLPGIAELVEQSGDGGDVIAHLELLEQKLLHTSRGPARIFVAMGQRTPVEHLFEALTRGVIELTGSGLVGAYERVEPFEFGALNPLVNRGTSCVDDLHDLSQIDSLLVHLDG